MTDATLRTRRRPALERVVRTADRLFYENGIQATGVDQVVEEAGVSKATLYTHFATKDALISHYLHGRSDAWREHLTAELERRGGSPRERIAAVFDVLGEWFAEDGYRGCPFINAEAEYDRSPAVHEVTLAHRAWVHALFAGLATEAGLSGADALVRQLTLLYDGSMTGSHSEPAVDWAGEAKRAALALADAAGASAPAR